MYNQPFYIPRFYSAYNPMMMRGTAGFVGRNNFFSKIGSLFGSFKNYNWSGLINNTSKTLGVINQTIPIVKQVKPVMNNMRSIIKIASIFKDETDSKKSINSNNTNIPNKTSYVDYDAYDESPTFFV